MCRRINVAYLWIDSLCIIQEGDNGADWQKEASLMGNVYKHAFCNIMAEAPANGDEGIAEGMFRVRKPAMAAPKAIYAPFNSGLWPEKVIPWRKSPKPGHFHAVAEDQWVFDMRGSPLLQRAWVEQEYQLASRCIHFSRDKVYYECSTHSVSETYPIGDILGMRHNMTGSRLALKQLAIRAAGHRPVHSPAMSEFDANPYATWHRLVERYSAGGLTKSKDKLIAIAGLAKELQPYLRVPDTDYLAGIWRADLIPGLLWTAPVDNRPSSRKIRSDYYQALSWSWASVNWTTEIADEMYKEPHDVLVDISETHVLPKSDPYGEVEEGAYLKVRGTTYGARLVWTEEQTNYKPRPKSIPEMWTGTGKFMRKFAGKAVMPDERYIE